MNPMQINLPIAEERDEEFGPSREMTKDDFLTIHQAIRSQTIASITETGQMPPTVFLLSMAEANIARMGLMPAGDLVNHPEGKDILALIINRLLEDPNYDFVVFSHEAWILQAQADDENHVAELQDALKTTLANHPKRTEAFVINIRSKNRQAMCIMPIKRDAQGTVSLDDGELIFSDALNANFQGRFTPPLTRPAGTTLH